LVVTLTAATPSAAAVPDTILYRLAVAELVPFAAAVRLVSDALVSIAVTVAPPSHSEPIARISVGVTATVDVPSAAAVGASFEVRVALVADVPETADVSPIGTSSHEPFAHTWPTHVAVSQTVPICQPALAIVAAAVPTPAASVVA
jgi:hypothetical protein